LNSFVFRALSQLVDHLFIQAARSIKVINLAGVKKIKRNILSLQQTLRNVHCGSAEGVLTRSVAYWDLYESGPKVRPDRPADRIRLIVSQNMMESIRTSKPMFSFEDYNTMLNLQCKTDQAEAPSSELNTYLIDLHALSMSIDGWETGEG
jgi:exocyst complex component 4